MLSRRSLILNAGLTALGMQFGLCEASADTGGQFAVSHTDSEWKKLLTADQFAVLRREGTERPFTSPLLHEERKGNFACAGCEQDAFASSTKFDSGTGWPSFWAPLDGKVIGTTRDTTLGMVREAVHCGRCGGHLGHVFDDGPKPTGLRYCLNGVALKFHPSSA
ncbi:methionine sulfoxide reductase B [Rhizobium sp. Root1203]|uniref:peptide-methionine (R)-S-oxide reductase MsrB n=1 Tax=Rhizobium sp. Root1203 TaxID=1736427 RepID=UPI00071112FD|nr:peptide-methionine (R)-S-oxide reductase MsrB [Rhizobium sp. Root1203]KQV12643.1 methionine sulfoxide reductase B [Rhizobium sp. Root1203]